MRPSYKRIGTYLSKIWLELSYHTLINPNYYRMDITRQVSRCMSEKRILCSTKVLLSGLVGRLQLPSCHIEV